METQKILEAYYQSYDEDNRLRSQHGTVEFFTTMHYLEKYLKPRMQILDVGAGTGRYAHALAQAGYHVDAVELVEHNIEIFRKNSVENEPVTVIQGNALDLSAFGTDTYDMTLLLGPMYHLFTEEDQLQALREAIRVTKKAGVVFVAYCNNDATMIQTCFGKGLINVEPFASLIDPVTFKASSTPRELFQLYRKEDVDKLMEAFNIERLHYLGTDMATNFMRDVIDAMDDEMFEAYLRYHLVICERSDMVGATHHMLDIFRKR